MLEVIEKRACGGVSHRHDSLFASLAMSNEQRPGRLIEIGRIECRRFCDAHGRRVHQLDDRSIPAFDIRARAGGGSSENPLNLGLGGDLRRQPLRERLCSYPAEWIREDHMMFDEPPKEVSYDPEALPLRHSMKCRT